MSAAAWPLPPPISPPDIDQHLFSILIALLASYRRRIITDDKK